MFFHANEGRFDQYFLGVTAIIHSRYQAVRAMRFQELSATQT